MTDRTVRTEPLLDDDGKPITLFGYPVVVSPDLDPEQQGQIVFGSRLRREDILGALREDILRKLRGKP